MEPITKCVTCYTALYAQAKEKHDTQSLAKMQATYLSITCQILQLEVLRDTGMYIYKYEENNNTFVSCTVSMQ
jgi:hypothetical protein